MNRATLIGNIGQEPEIFESSGGTKIANFSLATNKTYTNKTGDKVSETEWHRVVAFGKLAELVEQYFEKGKKYLVEGEIKTESQEKNGETRYYTKIVMNNFEFL